MPQLTCLCGYVHNLTPFPDEGYKTIRDRNHDAHFEDIRQAMGGAKDKILPVLDLWGHLYECPECGRLAWTRDHGETFQFFAPESVREDAP
jgi:hypothetical protein